MATPKWSIAEIQAKNATPKTRNLWGSELQAAVGQLQSMPEGKFEDLMLTGRQNSSNRRGGELNDFARNHSTLVRLAFGMKPTTVYDWGRVKQALANKQLRHSKSR